MTRKTVHALSVVAAAAALALLAGGCTPFSGPLPGDPAPAPYFIQHLHGEGTFPVNLDLGGATRDVYLTFVNPTFSTAWGSLTVSAASQVPVEEPSAGEPSARIVPEADTTIARTAAAVAAPRRAPTPEEITEFNQDPFGSRGKSAPSLLLFERPPASPLFDAEGSSAGGTFYNIDLSSVDATCRKVVANVPIAGGGTRTLNIWVADNCWYIGGSKAALVRPEMVDAMAGQFLVDGPFNDIYDWVTGMLGAEWGAHPYPELIPANGEITILLCDIEEDDEPEGGIVGYFWSKDNFTTAYEPDSSQRVMFTIDAVMYANGDPGDTDGDGSPWDPTDYWPAEIYSTLAHEFQHMIHFYQRAVLRDAMAAGDTWINEMASQVVEDLLSSDDKLDVIGPRGVDGGDGTAGPPGNTEGRLPMFNAYNDISLADWAGSGALPSYSITYAFGAWLARNYGGAALLDRLMRCTLTGPASIEDIVSQETGRVESFPRLLQRWSAAQLLSDVTDAPPGYRYNTGGFVPSTVGGNEYRLGSIDLFNYSPLPSMYVDGYVGTSQHLSTSSALYEAAIPGTGALDWMLDMPDGVIATIVVR